MSEECRVEELRNALHRCLKAMEDAGMQGRSCYDDGLAVFGETESEGKCGSLSVDGRAELLRGFVASVKAIMPMAESLNSFVANNDVWAENRKKTSRVSAMISDVEAALAGEE